MADFCKQCAGRLMEKDAPSDFAGLTNPEKVKKGLYPLVICEGCGPTLVDEEGRCISEDCLETGHKELKKS